MSLGGVGHGACAPARCRVAGSLDRLRGYRCVGAECRECVGIGAGGRERASAPGEGPRIECWVFLGLGAIKGFISERVDKLYWEMLAVLLWDG